MPTVNSSGTQTATLGTEHILGGAAITTAGVYVGHVRMANMTPGDRTELRVKIKTLAGSASEELFCGYFCDGQQTLVKVDIPVAATHEVAFTLKQTMGTITIATVTGTIPWGSSVTGLTSGATGRVFPLGGGNVAGTSTILQVLTGTFTNGETIQLSAGNNFVLNAAPAGRNYDWEIVAL